MSLSFLKDTYKYFLSSELGGSFVSGPSVGCFVETAASSEDRKFAKVNCMVDHHENVPNNKPNQILFHLHKHERFHETNKGNTNKAKAIQSSEPTAS